MYNNYFEKNDVGRVKLSGKGNCTLTCLSASSWSFSYGSLWINPSNSTTIKLKIDKIAGNYMAIGLSSATKPPKGWYTGNNDEPTYIQRENNNQYINGTLINNTNKKVFKTGDVVLIEIYKNTMNILVNWQSIWSDQKIDSSKNIDL